jgi:hypothetical protein
MEKNDAEDHSGADVLVTSRPNLSCIKCHLTAGQ